MLWKISFDWENLLQSVAIGVVVLILSFVIFYYLWLKNPFFNVPRRYFKNEYPFGPNASFFAKMRTLILDINNHDYWIFNIGFDAYCFLLLMRKLAITCTVYGIVYALASVLYFALVKIMSMGYLENKSFESLASDIYISFLIFILTALFLHAVRNLRREVQTIYFYYFSAPNEHRGLNFLRMRTILISGLDKNDLSGEVFSQRLNQTLADQSIYGKIYGYTVLPDITSVMRFECEKRSLEFAHQLNSQFNGNLNPIAKMMLPSAASDDEVYNSMMVKIRRKINSDLLSEHKGSGYAFAALSSFQCMARIHKNVYQAEITTVARKIFSVFSKKKLDDKNHFKMRYFVDYIDINWLNCFKMHSASKFLNIIIQSFIFLLITFLSTPTVFLQVMKDSPFGKNFMDIHAKKSTFLNFIIESYLPPLVILIINRLLLFAIMKLSGIIS